MANFNSKLTSIGFRYLSDKAGSYYERDGILISGNEPDSGECPYAPIDPEIPIVVMSAVRDIHRFYPNTDAAIAANFAIE